jgi:hypothetical protein
MEILKRWALFSPGISDYPMKDVEISKLVFTGKLARYAAVAWLTLGGMQMFKG